MATLKDYRDERLKKLEQLKTLGLNPYPADVHRTHVAAAIHDQFDELEGQPASVAGRITGIRKFGKLAFIVIVDLSGSLQLFLHAGAVDGLDAVRGQLGMDELNLLDTGS